MPAPQGNVNRMRHGKHSYLALGRLPKGASYIRRQLGEFRTSLEKAVQEKDDGIGIMQGALINSAVRHEGRAALLVRWLRIETDLSLSVRIALLREIGAASDSRDRCIKSLGLDVRATVDPWAVLDGRAQRAIPSEPPSSDPAAASVGATNGR